jgi:hypothetical protein
LPLLTTTFQEEKLEPIKKGKEAYLAGKEKSKMERRLVKLNERMEMLDGEIEEKRQQSQSDEATSDYLLLCKLSEEIEALEGELFEILEEIDEIEA